MFACIYIPDFAVQASLLTELPETRKALHRSPVVILGGPANLPRVFAGNAAARRAGIRAGMTKLQAEVCAGVILRKRSLDEEESAQSALLQCAGTFSPRVESTAPGTAILDLAGTEKIFKLENSDAENFGPANSDSENSRHPGNSNWEKAGKNKFSGKSRQAPWVRAVSAMTAKAAEAGFEARIAIAANPDAAFLAARGFPENTIIAAGGEANCLAPLPVEALPLSPEMLETLASWGIRTFESLAALPEVAVAERLGQQGLHLQKLARGAVTRPLCVAEPEKEFAAKFEFDDPVETLESIFFILNRLLQEVCERLVSAVQAASELHLTIGLSIRRLQNVARRGATRSGLLRAHKDGAIDDGTIDDDRFIHEWKLPLPTQDKKMLFSLIRLQLEKTTFSAPVRSLRLEVVAVKPRLAQGNLFVPPAPEPENLEITLERIRGVVGLADAAGIACVGSPYLLDTHKPDSFIVTPLRILEADSSAPRNSHRPKLPRSPSEQDCHAARGRPIRKTNQSVRPKDLCIRQDSSKSTTSIALQIFRPALDTTVELDGEKPYFVRLWSRYHRVLAASGPWSSSGNWWTGAGWVREEWDVTLQTPAGPAIYRIYRDRLLRQWFVEGVLD